jgi:hypothetical protein
MEKREKCGFIKKNGEPCKMPAGWGTDHVGAGCCKKHGGNGGRPIVHGRYSRKLAKRLKDKYEFYLQDPQRGTLDREYAELRALLDYFHEKIAEAEENGDKLREDYTAKELPEIPDPVSQYTDALMGVLEQIRKTVDTISKIQSRETLTMTEQVAVITILSVILREEVPDEGKLRSIFDKFRTRLQLPRQSGIKALLEG